MNSHTKSLLEALITGGGVQQKQLIPTWVDVPARELFAHLGDPKNSQAQDFRVAPPKPDCSEVNGIQFPTPLEELPAPGTVVYEVEVQAASSDLTGCRLLIRPWTVSSPLSLSRIHQGRSHLTADAAAQHLAALVPGWVKNLRGVGP